VIRQVQRGAVVEIDDCGVGMAPRELERVRAVASGARPVGIADLGEVPQTGLAVVGTYARLLGLRVDLTESVYGGLRAVALVPGELTATVAAPQVLAPSVDEAWKDGPPPGTPDAAGTAGRRADVARGPAGSGTAAPALPQRRSRRGATEPAPVTGATAMTSGFPVAEQTAQEAGAWIGAFFSADHPASPHAPDTQQPSVTTDATSEDR